MPTGQPRRVLFFRSLLVAAIVLNLLLALLITQQGPRSGPIVPVVASPTAPVIALATPSAAADSTALAVATTIPAVPLSAAMPIRGLNLPVWGPDFAAANPSIDRAARIGANWVSLVSHWYVSTAVPYTGGGIFREQGTAGTGNNRTASDESIGQSIDAAHAAGLHVMLKPHVDWTNDGWRGYFYFGDDAGRSDWWSSYGAMISATVQIAVTHHAEAISIGTEFDDINKEPGSATEWLKIIAQIRAAGYSGLLTYSANWGPYNDAEYDRPGLQGVWEKLDFVGVDAYYPISNEKDPSLQQLIDGWRDAISPWDPTFHQDNFAQLQRLHRRTGKDVVFTEIGYPATDFSAKNPSSGGEGLENDAAQARAVEAVFSVWGNVDWWQGMFWWQDGPSFNALSIAGRDAEQVLSQHWLAAKQESGAK